MSAHAGRIVRIMTFDDRGDASNTFWWAAINDDAGAIQAVKLAAGTFADQGVTVDGLLSSEDLTAHGVGPGKAVPAPK